MKIESPIDHMKNLEILWELNKDKYKAQRGSESGMRSSQIACLVDYLARHHVIPGEDTFAEYWENYEMPEFWQCGDCPHGGEIHTDKDEAIREYLTTIREHGIIEIATLGHRDLPHEIELHGYVFDEQKDTYLGVWRETIDVDEWIRQNCP
jgi:hypothetical protein